MIRQLVKLCWNRKRSQALVAVEVFFSFLVVFAVMTVAVYNVHNYRQPLGFDYHDVLNVNLTSLSDVAAGGKKAVAGEVARRLLSEVRGLEAVESVAGTAIPAFDLTGMSDLVEYQGRRLDSYNTEVTDDFAKVMRVEVTQGRWFEPADDALPYDPVLVNERLKRDLFGSDDPLGKNIAPQPDPPAAGQAASVAATGDAGGRRLQGLPGGRRAVRSGAVLLQAHAPRGRDQAPLQPGRAGSSRDSCLLRGDPHDPAARDRSRAAPSRSIPSPKMRRSIMRLKLVPFVAAALIAVFMLIMVALGMVGVLWQSVARRRREIGLRRALGATARGVSLQVLGELLAVTTAGLLLGAALAVQLPLMGVIAWIGNDVYATAMALAALTIYGLTVVAALYPSWLATQVQPAEALHDE